MPAEAAERVPRGCARGRTRGRVAARGVGGKQAGRVGGAAVGSGKRVTWGLGRRAHVSGGNRNPGGRAVRGRNDAPGPYRLRGGGRLASSFGWALTRSLRDGALRFRETLLEGRAGVAVAAGGGQKLGG